MAMKSTRKRKISTSTSSKVSKTNKNKQATVKEMFKPVKKETGLEVNTKNIKNSSTPKQEMEKEAMCSDQKKIIKRNLFGIRLNHDQLNRDLKEMWKEQIEKQKLQWNFDFERIKPYSTRNSKSLNNLSDLEASSRRYDWIKVNTYYAPSSSTSFNISSNNTSIQSMLSLDTSDMAISAFDKKEIDYEHPNYQNYLEDEEDEEEEDDALAIPQFYKYQRRFKLSESFNKTLSPSPSTRLGKQDMKETKTSDKKKKQVCKSTKNKINTRSNKIRKPSGRTKKQLHQNLIITFSENRKDTLRSACHHNLPAKQKDNLKQQSLLDLFKQRKRRSSTCNSGQELRK